MVPQGVKSWQTGEATFEMSTFSGTEQSFVLEHTFYVNPFYLVGELARLESLTQLPIS